MVVAECKACVRTPHPQGGCAHGGVTQVSLLSVLSLGLSRAGMSHSLSRCPSARLSELRPRQPTIRTAQAAGRPRQRGISWIITLIKSDIRGRRKFSKTDPCAGGQLGSLCSSNRSFADAKTTTRQKDHKGSWLPALCQNGSASLEPDPLPDDCDHTAAPKTCSTHKSARSQKIRGPQRRSKILGPGANPDTSRGEGQPGDH